jgi:archaellum component FlaC
MRSLYEISGIIDRMLDEDRVHDDILVKTLDHVLGSLTDINDRLSGMDREIENLKKYARKLKKSLNDIVSVE